MARSLTYKSSLQVNCIINRVRNNAACRYYVMAFASVITASINGIHRADDTTGRAEKSFRAKRCFALNYKERRKSLTRRGKDGPKDEPETRRFQLVGELIVESWW